jgi:hypothetical protein
MMAHPMHLHGHAFQVVAINGNPLAGAVRDTVLVPPMGSVTIAFDTDNPGRWAFPAKSLPHDDGYDERVRYRDHLAPSAVWRYARAAVRNTASIACPNAGRSDTELRAVSFDRAAPAIRLRWIGLPNSRTFEATEVIGTLGYVRQ